ncbi:hypothetical protein SAY87_020214 [Trapa incisa]|uniref:DUF7894 domain-containing protein n=1 Tax=Trapa incisa TaxID=236973 RepID=A0AAN7Q3Z7_9MYRT|nr:hypothetical protein SAY87_020214 [Trapa incisa]
MKTAQKVIFLFKDSDGLASSIYEALQPNPASSVRRIEESFEFPLEHYGIKDHRARIELVHFIDGNGIYLVSLLIMQTDAPPILACALNEVLEQVTGEEAQPTLFVLAVTSQTIIKHETRSLPEKSSNPIIYCMPVGTETNIPGAIFTKTEKAPLPLKVHYEPVAYLLHFVRILKLPTILLFGKRGGSSSDRSTEDIEMIVEMGEVLACTTNLSFSRDRISWNPGNSWRDPQDPWRALYG